MSEDECSLLQLIGVHEKREIAFDRQGKRIHEQIPAPHNNAHDRTERHLMPKISKDEPAMLKLESNIADAAAPHVVDNVRGSSRANELSEQEYTIMAHCSCGYNLKVKPDMVGKQAKCPKCLKTINIPGKEMKLNFDK